MKRERFLVPAYGPDINAISIGVKALELLCEKHNCDGLICMPVLKGAESTVLNQVWSEKHIKSLASGKVLKISEKHSLSMCSPFTLKNHNAAPLILALFASKDIIDKIEKSLGCKALIVIPWIQEDTELWIKTYAPTVLSLTNNG